MFDPERLLGQMLGESLGGGLGGYGRRKKKRRKGFGGLSTGTKAQLGIGVLGIAIAAWEHYKQKPGTGAPVHAQPVPRPQSSTVMPPPPPPGASPPAPSQPDKVHGDALAAAAPRGRAGDDALHLLRAMIAAAHADGRLDADEREAVMSGARDAGLDADDLRALDAELAAPRTLEAIVDDTRGALREQVYAVSLLAITVDTDAERAYLDRLAQSLRLSDTERSGIHARIEAARADAIAADG